MFGRRILSLTPHTLPGDGGQKSFCQWFLKGNCRFGHKCALAHVLPGQPMSMDRKIKGLSTRPAVAAGTGSQRVAWFVAAGVNGGGQQQQQQQTPVKPSSQRQVSGQQTQTQSQAGSQLPCLLSKARLLDPHWRRVALHRRSQRKCAIAPRRFTTRDHDMPFGLPEDLQASAPSTADPARAGFEGIHMSSHTSQNHPCRRPLQEALRSAVLDLFLTA